MSEALWVYKNRFSFTHIHGKSRKFYSDSFLNMNTKHRPKFTLEKAHIKMTITEKLYIGLCLLAKSSWNSYKFLCDKSSRSIFYSHNMTLDGLLLGSCIGAAHQEDQALIRNLEFSVLLPQPPERGEELELELYNNWSFLVEAASIKPDKHEVWRASRLQDAFTLTRGRTPTPRGQRPLNSGFSQILPSACFTLSVHLYLLSYPLINWQT